MENLFTHFDLTEFPQIDRKEEIIETQKKVKKILKDSRNQAKKKTRSEEHTSELQSH